MNFFNTDTPFPRNDLAFHQQDDRGDIPRFRRYLEALSKLPTPQAMPLGFTHGAVCVRHGWNGPIDVGHGTLEGDKLSVQFEDGSVSLYRIEGWVA